MLDDKEPPKEEGDDEEPRKRPVPDDEPKGTTMGSGEPEKRFTRPGLDIIKPR